MAAAGVPEIVRVAAFQERPWGRESVVTAPGPVSAWLTVASPPLAAGSCRLAAVPAT